MTAGLSTPLHLAASLLALSAAVGLLVAGTAALRGHRPGGLPLSLGAVLLAVGHMVAGALLEGVQDLGAWLRAGGVLLAALGLAPVSAAPAGAALVVPAAPLPATLVAVLGGLVALLRLVPRRATALAGLGLLCWGAAETAGRRSATLGAALVLTGALLLGWWLWLASARRLLARVTAAFVTTLLVLVVAAAAIVSGANSRQLVDEQLARLADTSARLAEEVGAAWPRDAIAAARPLRNSGELLLSIAPEDRDRLAEIADLSFRLQDFFVLLDGGGRVHSAYSEDPELLSGSFTLALTGAQAVDRILEGREEDGGLITVGGELVALGAVRLAAAEARAEEPPIGVLLTGRVVDEVWAAQTATELSLGVVVEVADAPSVASPSLPVEAEQPAELVAEAVNAAPGGAVIRAGERTAYAAAAEVRDPNSGTPLGAIAVVSAADVIAQLEEDQTSRLFLLALLGAVAAGAIGGALTRRLVAPIRRLTAAAEAVRAGRLDAKADVRTSDELGRLGRTFDEMTSSLAAQSAELVEAAEVQRRLRARLEAMTASMGDALVAVDGDGLVTTFNPAAERLTGRRSAEAIGAPLERVVRLADGAPGELFGAADSERSSSTQVQLRGPRGRAVPAAVTAAPVRDPDGKVLGRVLVLRDMTREAEVERMKAEFLANVSHELRTPLTPIKGYADILARRDLEPAAAKRYAQQILESSRLLERIVGMIVDFAALDSGQVDLTGEPVRLDTLVADVLREWRERQPSREFTRRVGRGLPPVAADAGMLRRALDELLDNAVKFSPEGQAVTVSAAAENDGRHVRLTVRDRGVGVDSEAAANLFGDFFQLDASETRKFGGLGLGLSLVRRIVEGLGGDARIAPAAGGGTEVHLLLPAAEEPRKRSRT